MAIGTANQEGTSNNVPRADHVHAHGSLGAIANAHGWADINKTGSSIADIVTRDHHLLTGLSDPDHLRSAISDFWGSPFWANIPDKPSTFPPSSHSDHPSISIGGTTVITSGRVLQNVMADAGIITGGVFALDRIPTIPTGKVDFVTPNAYLHVKSEGAGKLRVGAAWSIPGIYSGDDGNYSLILGCPSGQKVYLGVSTGDAWVEGGTGHSYFKGNQTVGGSIDSGSRAQSRGTTNTFTTSTSPVDMADMSITLTTGACKIAVEFTTVSANDTAGRNVYFRLLIDGVEKERSKIETHNVSWEEHCFALSWLESIGAGSHTFKIQWWVSGNQGANQKATYPDHYHRVLQVFS